MRNMVVRLALDAINEALIAVENDFRRIDAELARRKIGRKDPFTAFLRGKMLPAGVVLTIEGLPRLLIFGQTREEALRRAREALIFQLSVGTHAIDPPLVELVPRAAA